MRPVTQSVPFRLALLALIWGSSFLWIKLADRGFAPAEVTFARLALGAAALFPLVAARREALPRPAARWAQIALAALSPTRSRTCCLRSLSGPWIRPRPESSTPPRHCGP
jgi:drug/metabolite transporter (DMT)-like permease